MSSLKRSATSIFRQKMDSPNPSEMDIKVFIPAPTFSFTVSKNIFPKWEKEKYFLSCESEIK